MTMKDRLLILVLIIQGCASKPIGPMASTVPVLIESKVQIKDLKRQESHNAKVEIILAKNQILRMEVSALFGIPLATLVMSPTKIQYALHTTKEYAEGTFTAQTLHHVFKQDIDPRILWNVIHNRNPEAVNLKCVKDIQLRPLSCMGPSDLKVTWSYEADPAQRRVDMRSPQFEMIWVFKGQSPFTASQNETFVLNKPDGYQEIRLK